MVERSQRGKGKLLGSHQKCWIWGRHVVQETLRAAMWPPLELYLSTAVDPGERDEAADRARALSTKVFVEDHSRLRELCKSGEHQGFVARMPEFPYSQTAAVLQAAADFRAIFVLLDGIQDPHNLGAIIRSADAFGVRGVFLAGSNQVGVTSLVTRSSAGAVNHVPIVRDDLSAVAQQFKDREIPIVGTHQSAELTFADCDLSASVALVIGNEHAGISPEVQDRCDVLARIPQSGRVGSLNAAVAAGIAFYEADRQAAAARKPEEA